MQINPMNRCEWLERERERRERIRREATIVNAIGIAAVVFIVAVMIWCWWTAPRDMVSEYYGGDAAARARVEELSRGECVAIIERVTREEPY